MVGIGGSGPEQAREPGDGAVDGSDALVRDPLRLTQFLIDRALSVAGLLLRVDAVVLR